MTVFFSAGVGCIGYGSVVTEGEWFLELQVARRDRREGPSSNNTRPVFLSDDDINGANAEQQEQYQQQQAAAAACAV